MPRWQIRMRRANDVRSNQIFLASFVTPQRYQAGRLLAEFNHDSVAIQLGEVGTDIRVHFRRGPSCGTDRSVADCRYGYP